MKSRNRKSPGHGCPGEREYPCGEKDDNGWPCQQPAVVLDYQRGRFICERHQAQRVTQLRLVALGLQAA